MLLIFNDKVGKGKTTICVFLAFCRLYQFTNLETYANFEIDIPNFHYKPYLLLQFEKMVNLIPKVLIFDDIKMLSGLRHLLNVISSYQRKINADIYISGQYGTMIVPEIREQADYLVKCNYIRDKDMIEFNLIDQQNKIQMFKIHNVNLIHKKFNTNQVVKPITERVIKKVILNSDIDNINDLENNVMMLCNNKTTSNKLMRFFVKEMNISQELSL